MATYRIIITPWAGTDLETIYDHIARDSATNVASMISRILDALEPLKLFPHRAIVERNDPTLRHPVRSLAVRPYLVYFRVLGRGEGNSRTACSARGATTAGDLRLSTQHHELPGSLTPPSAINSLTCWTFLRVKHLERLWK
jgi:plasmid stabilization system protein ParE